MCANPAVCLDSDGSPAASLCRVDVLCLCFYEPLSEMEDQSVPTFSAEERALAVMMVAKVLLFNDEEDAWAEIHQDVAEQTCHLKENNL